MYAANSGNYSKCHLLLKKGAIVDISHVRAAAFMITKWIPPNVDALNPMVESGHLFSQIYIITTCLSQLY